MDDNWDKIQNFFDEGNPDEQGGRNKVHPKIYVGWAKHATFSQRNTGGMMNLPRGVEGSLEVPIDFICHRRRF
ncbi:hypothetical protein BGX38DRAFT_1177022 [Terfezia claveryi]|nr:hypothetical protein BGX38DRAFT_1177022 [Terfezia claveryi]